MKYKISGTLPTAADLLAGLTPGECHPALGRAERDAADADRAIARARHELAELELEVTQLPARVQRGEAKAAALTDAMRARDAAALMIHRAEAELAKARERITVEAKAADIAVMRELDRRVELLEKVAADITPVLDEINTLARAIAAKLGPSCVITSIDWPESPADMASRARLAMGVPTVPAFGNSKGNT